MLPQNEQSDTFFSNLYNHSMSSEHHVGVQYVLQYCHYYRSTFGIKKFSFSFLKKAAFYSA